MPVKDAHLSIRLLGCVEVLLDGEPITLAGNAERLLAFLVVQPAGWASTQVIAEAMWEDLITDQARTNVRKRLYHLRQAFGEAHRRWIARGSGWIQLALEGASIDLLKYQAAVRKAAEGRPRDLEDAVGLYGGAFLPGCDEPWAERKRQELLDAHLGTLQALADHARRRGDRAAECRWLGVAAAADPLSSVLHHRWIEALSLAGDYSRAFTELREFRARLLQEGIPPSDQIPALAEQLRAARKEARPLKARTPATEGRSKYRLMLPSPSTPLIGREAEIRLVVEELERYRLVSLLGIGGVGKTRLAIAVGEQLAPTEQFIDGVFFLDLTGLHGATPESILSRFFPKEPDVSPLDAAVQFFSRREGIVVLDNCEHVIQAAAAIARVLLDTCRGVRIIVTSREPLQLWDERRVCVRGLSVPTGPPDHDDGSDDLRYEPGRYYQSDAERVQDFAATRLFVDRAQANDPQWRLDLGDAACIAQICRQLDGIPLSIIFAAALCSCLSVQQISAQMPRRFEILASEDHTLPARQQGLQAVLDWSYELLDAEKQQYIRRLSVLEPGWTPEAAFAVTAAESRSNSSTIRPGSGEWDIVGVSRILAGLRDRGWIEPILWTSRRGVARANRYRMLSTVREFAAAKVGGSERAGLERQHSTYYTSLLEYYFERYCTEARRQYDEDFEGWVEVYESSFGRDVALEWYEAQFLDHLSRQWDAFIDVLQLLHRREDHTTDEDVFGSGSRLDARLSITNEILHDLPNFWACGAAKVVSKAPARGELSTQGLSFEELHRRHLLRSGKVP
jgi:predicted ATPase/DNA-binding SARP family transcriptional activator